MSFGKTSIYRQILETVTDINAQSTEIAAAVKNLTDLMEQNRIEIEKLNCAVSEISSRISSLEEKADANEKISAEQMSNTVKALKAVGKSLSENNKVFRESVDKILDMSASAAAEYSNCIDNAINSVMSDNILNLIP